MIIYNTTKCLCVYLVSRCVWMRQYPVSGSTMMSRGWSMPFHTSTVRMLPFRLETSITSSSASVQYSFLPTQSTAMPAGTISRLFTSTYREVMGQCVKKKIYSHLLYCLKIKNINWIVILKFLRSFWYFLEPRFISFLSYSQKTYVY